MWRAMLHPRFLTCALVCAFSTSCVFDSDDHSPSDESDSSALESEYRDGASIWMPCTEDPQIDGELLDGWGCAGVDGDGLACLMTIDGGGTLLTICVPQIADPEILATCEGLPSPPSSGVTGPHEGLCVPFCGPGDACEPGYSCSVDNICAVVW